MTENQFWDIIEQSDAADGTAPAPGRRREKRAEQRRQERQVASVRHALEALPADQILDFDKYMWRLIDEAYDWDLWGAAYTAKMGCSDDSFEYFRAWLVSRGRKVYRGVLAHPDSLLDHMPADPDDMDFEDLLRVVYETYRRVAGKEPPAIERSRRPQPRGERWEFDDLDQVRRRLPRLFAHIDAEDEEPRKPWWQVW